MSANVAQPAVRAFQAPNMLQALQAVQRELGPEALIVSVRQIPPGPAWQVWRKPAIEVVAMPGAGTPAPTVASADASPAASPATVARRPAARPAAETGLVADVAQVKSAVAAMSARLDQFAPSTLPEALAQAAGRLAAQGVAEDVTQSVVATCLETLSPRALADAARVRDHLQRQLEAGLRVWGSSALAAETRLGETPRVVALIGTSGSGKTTTIARLAAHHARSLGLRVAWVCADTYRAGAISQARIYAEALKLPLRIAYTPDEVAQAAQTEKAADLILVDTPGCNPRREMEVVELGELLAALPGRMTLLAAPATAKDADLAEALAAFGTYDLRGLVLTRLDETSTLGSAFNIAWRSRLPMIYFTTGPGVLDGLLPAHAGRLVSALFEEDLF